MRHPLLALLAPALALAACAAPPAAPSEPVEPPAPPPVAAAVDSVVVSPVCPPVLVYYSTPRANYSLGYEHYKNLDYCAALPYLRWLVEHEPLFTGADPDDRNFRRLADTYEQLAAMAGDDADLRRAYLDSALVVRDRSAEALRAAGLPVDSAAVALGRARFYQIYAEDYPDAQDEVLARYREAFAASPDLFVDYDLNAFGRLLFEHDVQEAARLLPDLVAQAEDPSYLQQLQTAATAPGAVDPETLYASLLERYRAGDRDPDLLRRLAALDIQLNRNAVIDELLPQLVALNPSAELYAALGARANRQGELDEALGYYERAIALAGSDAQRADLYYQMASAAYNAGQAGRASGFAGQALQYNPNHGRALYLRASVFAAGLGGTSVEARAAYWCAADQFARAAATGDPAIAASARRAAARYAAAGPSRQEYFFLGWQPGQRITVPAGGGTCTTTVR